MIKPIVQSKNLHYPSLSENAHQDIRGIIYRIYNTYNGKSYITYEKGLTPSYPIWYKLTNGQYMETNRNFQMDYDNHMTSFKIEWLSVFYDEDDLDAQIRHFRLFYGGVQELLLYNLKETRRLLSKTQTILAKNESMITELQNTVFNLTTELNTLRAQQPKNVLAEVPKNVPVDIASVVTEELFKEIIKRAEQKPKEFLVLLNKIQSDILFNSLDINNIFKTEESKDKDLDKNETLNTLNVLNNEVAPNDEVISNDEVMQNNEVISNNEVAQNDENVSNNENVSNDENVSNNESVLNNENNKFKRFEKFSKSTNHKKKAKKHKHKTDELTINLSNLDEEDAYQMVLSKWQFNKEKDDTSKNIANQNDVNLNQNDLNQNESIDVNTFNNTSNNVPTTEETVLKDTSNSTQKWKTASTAEHYDEYNAKLIDGTKLFDMKFDTPLKTVLPDTFFWYDGSMPVMKWVHTYRKELRNYPNFYRRLKEEANFCNINYTRGNYMSLILYLKGATIEEMQNLLKRDKPMANVDSLQGSLPALYLVSGCGAKANKTVKGKKQVVNKRCIDILKGFGVDDIPEAILNSFSPRNFHTHTVVSVKNLDANKVIDKEKAFVAFQEKLAMLSKAERDKFFSMLMKDAKKIS